jgi:hypothetical protein
MKKIISVVSLTIFVQLAQFAVADRLPRYSLDRMMRDSEFVADGRILSIKKIDSRTEGLPGYEGTETRYMAMFQVESIIKGSLEVRSRQDPLALYYWWNDNPRYKGEPLINLNIGDRFRLFSELPPSLSNGRMGVVIGSMNAVRPEAYRTSENLDSSGEVGNSTVESSGASIVQRSEEKKSSNSMPAEVGAIVSSASSKNSIRESIMIWTLVGFVIMMLLAGLFVIFKRRLRARR